MTCGLNHCGLLVVLVVIFLLGVPVLSSVAIVYFEVVLWKCMHCLFQMRSVPGPDLPVLSVFEMGSC